MPASKSASAGKPDADIAWFRKDILERHGIFSNKEDATQKGHDKDAIYDKYPSMKVAVDRALKNGDPTMRDFSARKIVRTVDRMDRMSEDRFFSEVWGLIFKRTHEVREGEVYISKEWADDGLSANPNQLFLKSTVSDLKLSKEEEKIVEEHVPRLKTPKPDICFGIDKAMFTNEELLWTTTVKEYVNIQAGLYLAFAVAEFKGPGGTIQEAEDQASRSGSTLVDAARQIQSLAGERTLDHDGADDENIMFSICMTTSQARLYVHWKLNSGDDNAGYHMSRIRSFDLSSEEQLKNLRHDIEAIVDWGLITHKERMKTLLEKVHGKQVAEMKEKDREKKNGKGGASTRSTTSGQSAPGSTHGSASSALG
ncbi:MAG: hypothetical protein LQ350_006768 [Teloschistes chrysophthalmus]|nr:MAG: hypothetical protein LQ350_006768 [Niorma chrysophthalma]